MKLKKIKPYLWIVLVGYLMLMVGVYLEEDLPFFLWLGGIFTMGLGVLSWMGNVLGFPIPGTDGDARTYTPQTRRGWIQMKLKKINPYLWIVLVGYLMLMVGVYLEEDLPFFLWLGGIFTMGLGILSWMGNISGFSGSSSDGDTHK